MKFAYSDLSDERIGQMAGVSQGTVAGLRERYDAQKREQALDELTQEAQDLGMGY